VSVMAPADRVSAHDLPLAESLSAIGVEREKYHITNRLTSIFIHGKPIGLFFVRNNIYVCLPKPTSSWWRLYWHVSSDCMVCIIISIINESTFPIVHSSIWHTVLFKNILANSQDPSKSLLIFSTLKNNIIACFIYIILIFSSIFNCSGYFKICFVSNNII